MSCIAVSALALAAFSASALAPSFAEAAAGEQDQKKFLEEERRKEMDARPKPDEDMRQPVLWDAGGWLHAQLDYLEDPPFRNTRTDRYIDLRLWGELRIERTYTAYVRLQTDYTDFNKGDQLTGGNDNQFRWPHLDQAWVQADWTEEERGLKLRAGREFVSLGSGLLFNSVAYALQGTWEGEQWAMQAFVAHSIVHEDDIDQSRPNPDDSHRLFFALEAQLLLTGNHRA
ncbi:MAG: hypothetical protein HY293_18370, partial [Planctomycetes bacterium]|nr:hypothetical protein [Planctomycetota bacterium]